MGSPKYQNDGDPATSGPGFKLTLHLASLDVPRRWRAPRLVFVDSMSDLFHDDVPPEFIAQVFEVIRETPQHTYQVLTKRAQRLSRIAGELDWPPNLWMGVSVETRRYAFRIEHLRKVPAAVRFWGGRTPKAGGRELEGELWDELPVEAVRSSGGREELLANAQVGHGTALPVMPSVR